MGSSNGYLAVHPTSPDPARRRELAVVAEYGFLPLIMVTLVASLVIMAVVSIPKG